MSAYQCCGTYDDDQHAPNCVMKELASLRSENEKLKQERDEARANADAIYKQKLQWEKDFFVVQDQGDTLAAENARLSSLCSELREVVKEAENAGTALADMCADGMFYEDYDESWRVLDVFRSVLEKLRDRERGR